MGINITGQVLCSYAAGQVLTAGQAGAIVALKTPVETPMAWLSRFQQARNLIRIAAGYKAKVLCSSLFVSGRPARAVLAEDLGVDDLAPLRLVQVKVDPSQQQVQASVLGWGKRTARYFPGQGARLLTDAEARSEAEQAVPAPTDESAGFCPGVTDSLEMQERGELPWGDSSAPPAPTVEAVLDWAFSEPQPERQRRTRAILVVHRGQIVAERYAEGFAADTPMAGWSMTKSVVNALIGILVGQDRLALEERHLLPAWQQGEDPRQAIALEHLLRMTSGLKFEETYTQLVEDVTQMLFNTDSAAAWAAAQPLVAAPGTQWQYSSGTTNLLTQVVRQRVGEADYLAFPHRELFDPLGMASAVLETDPSGTYVGSSFMHATARDWAKFGLLYLHDGVWQGRRILPEGWVTYSTTPTVANPDFGAHWWLTVPPIFTRPEAICPPLPLDLWIAAGYQGQLLTIIPSRHLVVVRLGLAQRAHSWPHDEFLARLLTAIPAS